MEKIINKTAPRNTIVVCDTVEQAKMAAEIANNFGWVTNRNTKFGQCKDMTEPIHYNFEEGTISIAKTDYDKGTFFMYPESFIMEYGNGKDVLPKRLADEIEAVIITEEPGQNREALVEKLEQKVGTLKALANSIKLTLHIMNIMELSATSSYVLVLIENNNVLLETQLFEEKAKSLLKSDNVEYIYQLYGKRDIVFERTLTKEEASKILLNKTNE